jgi:UDP-N-acetylmuramoyl-tripeptide--D-alanyl-D-alanine ligase
MRDFCLSELEMPLAGRLQGADASFSSVSTDSRTLLPGELFVALRGPSFDGHGFIELAAERGAAGALVSEAGDFPVSSLKVRDTREALGQLAALNRKYFSGRLVGITGSSGKTTVKNMLGAILRQRAPTLATAGNLNNEIGLPLTLLQLQQQHRYAVIEMGASRAGDIAYLCELASPDVAVLLNALPAHLEGFGDLAGVAKAKGEIFASLGKEGVAIINADSEFAPLWREIAQGSRSLEFGYSEGAAVTAREVVDRGVFGTSFRMVSGRMEAVVELPLPGRHNVLNALAAGAAALAVGMELPDIASGLASLRPEPGRMQVTTTDSGLVVVDDSYNANPGSVKAAIDLLTGCAGRKVLVLGAMAELGADSERLHEDIGCYARERGVDELWLAGAETLATARGFGEGAWHCAGLPQLLEKLRDRFGNGDLVLVKGSRSAGMEAVVTALCSPDSEED